MTKEELFTIFLKALSNVRKDFYEILNPDTYEEKEHIKHTESLFCYELYHQLRVLTKDESFFINAEIKKQMNHAVDDGTIEEGLVKSENWTNSMEPDIVCHLKQSEKNPDGQFLILECKTNMNSFSKKTFTKDFYNLNRYISYFNFEYSIYLIVNIPIDEIIKQLDKYLKEQFVTTKGKVIILIKESFESNVIQLDYEGSVITQRIIIQKGD